VTDESNGGIKPALLTVAIAGGALTLGALGFYGLRPGASVGLGALVAAGNLYALARIVDGVVARKSPVWGALGFVKIAALLGLVGLLLARGFAQALPFCVGFAALPLGIALHALGSLAVVKPRS
jgi:hypothetical protein